MKNIVTIALIAIIVAAGSILIFLTVTYGGNIFGTQDQDKENTILALGDCVDINYIGRYASNGTIFNSSYLNPVEKAGGNPLKVYMSWNRSHQPPTGYENYTWGIKGLVTGLVGLKEGDSKTIGPISPTDGYGIYPKTGDNFTLYNPTSGKEIIIQFISIIPNSAMPKEYVASYGTGNTTLFTLRYNYYTLGEKTTLYPSWENATVVTKVNDTKLWMYTTPSVDKTTNFTWISISNDGYSERIFSTNRSSITSINDTTIIVTHNPRINDTITQLDHYYGNTYYFRVVKLTNEKMNVSYTDENTGDTSYYEFNRTITIVRNESQNTTFTYPIQMMEQVFSYLKTYYDPYLIFNVNQYADKYLIYEVQIVKIYKTS